MLPEILQGLHDGVVGALVADLGVPAEQLEPTAGVAVRLGPLREDLDVPDAVGVAVDAVSEDIEPASAVTARGPRWAADTWQVTCVAQSVNGDDDLVAATRRAEWLAARVEAATSSVTGLAGVWEAAVTSRSFRPIRRPDGAVALVELTVRVETMRQETRR